MIGELIVKKSRGKNLTLQEIKRAVSYILENGNDRNSRSFMIALNSFGMSFKEVCYLAQAVRDSGIVLKHDGIVFEKHSTGAVSDSSSLVIVPVLASLGYKIVKVMNTSYRYTNGGIDRLHSIPNFNTEPDEPRIYKILEETNACLISNRGALCPVEPIITEIKKICDLDADINLVAALLVGKKLSSGANAVLIDVKFGPASLIESYIKAKKLASLLKKVFAHFKVKCVVTLTDTRQTISDSVGNAVEVLDEINVLQGRKCLLRDISVAYSVEMIRMVDKKYTKAELKELVEMALDNGSAYQKLLEIVSKQDGDRNAVVNNKLFTPYKTVNFVSEKDGYVGSINVLMLGELIRRLCVGTHDKNIGATLRVKIGDYVKAGDVVLTLCYKNDNDLNRYKSALMGCVKMTSSKIKKIKTIKRVMR